MTTLEMITNILGLLALLGVIVSMILISISVIYDIQTKRREYKAFSNFMEKKLSEVEEGGENNEQTTK